MRASGPPEVTAALAELRAARPDLQVLDVPEERAAPRWQPAVAPRRGLLPGCTIC